MFRRSVIVAFGLTLLAGAAYADPVEGNWRLQSGATAQISSCGSSLCIQLVSGKYSGKSIGKLKSDGSSGYTGSLTDPVTDKTYSGKGTLSGNSLKMNGCMLGGLICRTQTWTRL